MQPIRLLVVATAMVAVLALVAGLAATSDRVERERTTTQTTAVRPAPAVKELSADVPREKPIEMRVGDTLTLNVTLPQDDTLELPAFGIEESIAAKVKTEVLITAPTVGRYELRLQDADQSAGEIIVKPARASAAPTQTTPDPETPAAPSSELGTPSR